MEGGGVMLTGGLRYETTPDYKLPVMSRPSLGLQRRWRWWPQVVLVVGVVLAVELAVSVVQMYKGLSLMTSHLPGQLSCGQPLLIPAHTGQN